MVPTMGERRATLIPLLILSFTLMALTNAEVVGASVSIYIRADGSVEGTDRIQRDGDVYTFTGYVYGRIMVQAASIVIDGAGYTLSGLGDEAGITLARSNVTIKNIQITDFIWGIIDDLPVSDDPISDCIISGNTIKNNERGIQLRGKSKSFTISGNYITSNDYGIALAGTSDNIITGNTIKGNDIGIQIGTPAYSYGVNKIYNNILINNGKQIEEYTGAPPDPRFKNVWDNGTIGNYWSDYNGTDNNGNGIGDTPYIIDEDNQDIYPLIEPAIIPEFPSWIIPPLFLIATLSIIICRKKLQKKMAH